MIKVAKPIVGKEEEKALIDVLYSGNYVSGKKVKEFEERFAEYNGVDYAVAVSNGTAALQVALAAYGIGPGDEVVVPPMTFFSTISSVMHQNAVPVFADIDRNYCMDPESIKEIINERTKAIIPVHLFGQPCLIDKIKEIAQEQDIKIIEDCAQAHGSMVDGRKVGSIGDVGAFSFFATKHMTTGEGGIITTNDKKVADLARIIRSHGMVDRDTHIYLGYNYRMNEFAAALGIAQLKKLDSFNKTRIENSRYILDNLKSLDWLHIQDFKDNEVHTFFWCPVRIKEEKIGLSTKEVIAKLNEKGIEVRQRYYEPLNKQPVLRNGNLYGNNCPLSCKKARKIDYYNLSLPNAERFAGKIIGLPNHPELEKEEMDYIIQTFDEIKGGKQK